ncbi:MAG: hypothetical protein EPN37_15560 [Chitinophagaceae bacterium]|nr:MAG: hypothetical protein EPN37_15560 [Chitinophagaceae bacterium]
MDAITIFPENQEQEKTLEAVFQMMQLRFEKNITMADAKKRIEELTQMLQDVSDCAEIERRMNEPDIPAEQVYAEIEKKWK